MPSADSLELPLSNSADSDAMAQKRQMCDEMESEISEKQEVVMHPKKIFRRAEPVQVVNLSNLVYENLVVLGGLMKYKPSSLLRELHLNLTTKEHKLIVQKATLESDEHSKFEFDVPGGGILASLAQFIEGVRAAPLVQKRLEEGYRFITPLRSNMIHATVDFREKAKKTPTTFEVIFDEDNYELVSNFAEFNAAMWKLSGFCDWEATVQVAPCVYFMDKGSEPVVILCFYVTQMYLTKSAPKALDVREVVRDDELEL
jgi:hypothetical protein